MTAYPLSAPVIALAGTAGLVLQSGLPQTGKIRPGMFCFYTSQSNLLVVVYEFALFTAWLLRADAVFPLLAAPGTALAVTVCIWGTHLIYHFALLPYVRRTGRSFVDSSQGRIGNILVHYVTPLLTVLQWLLLADKTGLGVRHALYWLVIPLYYLIYILLRARTGKPIGNTDLLYPYFFLDYPSLGRKKFCLNVAILLVTFFTLAMILVGLSKILP